MAQHIHWTVVALASMGSAYLIWLLWLNVAPDYNRERE